ncbi:hypothetical protein ACQP2X_34335 [Actinoplanes sp. CA-131856]
MTANPAPLFPWPEPWAVQAAVEADRIEHRLRAATTGTLTDAQQVSRAAVESHLSQARDACRCASRRKRRGLRDKWRGTSVESAYMHLHAAKIFLVDLLPCPEFEATVPEATTRLAMVFGPDDPRRCEVERMLENSPPDQRRAVLKQVMETAYDARDEEYVRLRDFRNIILIVAALGAVGGFLGALIAIRNLRGTSTPYSVSTALAVLKVPAGALSAIIGILLLSGGFVPGLTNLDNQRQILAYALLLGIAQQLVTRVADDRAQQILDHLPSKETRPEAKPS